MISTWRVQAIPNDLEDMVNFDESQHYWVVSAEHSHAAIVFATSNLDAKRYEGWTFSATKIGET